MNTWVQNDTRITQLIILKIHKTKKVSNYSAFPIQTVLQGNQIVDKGRFRL